MKEKRSRNAEATRRSIEHAARECFGRKGFDQVGLREIAKKAGVDVALVSRYFGSKEGLFEAAVIPAFNADLLMEGGMETFSSRLAELMVDPDPDHKAQFDNTLALLLSIASKEVGPKVSKALEDAVVTPLAEKAGGEDAQIKMALAVAAIMGFDALYRIAKLQPLLNSDKDALRGRLERLLDCILDEPGSARG